MAATMKAVVQSQYGDPSHLRVADLPIPTPKRGQIRVKVLACAINLSDWEYLVGAPFYARMAGGIFGPKRKVLGSDIVGIVEEIGAGVSDFQTGDRVAGDLVMTRGGFAQYACVPAKDLAKVPDGLDDITAACMPQSGGIAVTGTKNVKAGQRLLINGAGGGSGPLAIQLAKAAGAHVTAVDNGSKTEWMTDCGADEVLNYEVTDFTTTGATWDHILDMVATRKAAEVARALPVGGTYRATGGGFHALFSVLGSAPLWKRKGKSLGMLMVNSGRALTSEVLAMAATGQLRPHISARIPLSGVPQALAQTGAGLVKGKIVVCPWD